MKSYKDYPKLNNDRINFSKISGNLELPYLVEIQTESYKSFLETGINEVLNEIFPIESYSKNLSIEYRNGGYRLEPPKHTPLECKDKDLTYSSSLRVKLYLNDKVTGELKESEVFMGEIPLMTESGTFIINGAERVIVSQIVRSPGAYLKVEFDNKLGRNTYHADLIPTRGTWLEFESDVKNYLWVRIDRQRKMPATILLKALGFEKDEDIRNLFGDRESLNLTLEKDKENSSSLKALKQIFSKFKPGEPITDDGVHNFLVQKFFDEKRYDLGRAGRFKFRQKLGIYNRLVDRILAEDLIDADGELKYRKGTLLTKELVDGLVEEEFFEKGAHRYELDCNKRLDTNSVVNIVKVYANDKKDVISNIIGTDLNLTLSRVTISDMVAIFSSFMNLMDGFGSNDDIDHLSNRRIRRVGELIQTQFRIGLTKMAKSVVNKMSTTGASDDKDLNPQTLINVRPLGGAIKDFFASSQLSQFMDQINPLAELANKRRISALGPGGLTRDRASMEVRDVHFTHYGRICPIETPEGQNIGLINNLATYAKVDKYGFIETPYRKYDAENNRILEDAVYLTADEENDHVIAQATSDIHEGQLIKEKVVSRFNGENVLADRKKVDFVDESPIQIVSVAAACIPFLEHDDNTRALMGANMQRQALPLLRPHAPLVGTGLEHKIATDCGLAVVAINDGVVTYSDSRTIHVLEEEGERIYTLRKFERSNNGTCINQTSIVKKGDKVTKGQIIADGPSMDQGDLALGQNVTIAFMTWEGYNYEDAVIMSERLVKDDVYTTIHIESYEIECRDTKNGEEMITPDVPNISMESKAHLDKDGIVIVGTEVREGDILVGKTTPKGSSEPSPETKLLDAIFGDKSKDNKDSSLRVPHGGAGTVLDVRVFTRENGDELAPGVKKKVRVYVVQKRKISEGDKMSGRHGNKGVISRILPVEDMPYLPDGTPVDIMLNPQGVPSRMNIGQVLEVHLGMALKKLGNVKIATPVFDGISNEEIMEFMKEAKCPSDGKYTLYDGRTGEKFDDRINVGVMYMIKLVHMVDDKLHARATGPYSMVTQQPLGGKAQNGGQRFGEMEVWALEAYGAAHTLQEMLTIKSDDRVGRRKTYEALIKNKPISRPSIPEAFKVLTKELMALGIDVELHDKEGRTIDMDALARQTQKEEQKSMHAAKNYGMDHMNEVTDADQETANELLN